MAVYRDLEQWVRGEHGDQPSCDDQVFTGYWFLDRDITAANDKQVRTSSVEEQVDHRLDHEVRQVLDNLEKIGVLVQIPPAGGGGCIRHHRTDELFFAPGNEEYVPYLDEEVSRLIEDMHSQEENHPLPTADGGAAESAEQPTMLRSIAASVLEVETSAVEEQLTEREDPFERMLDFDEVIGAIRESEEVSRNGNYDEMGWRNFANKWTLSERAMRMEQNESIV